MHAVYIIRSDGLVWWLQADLAPDHKATGDEADQLLRTLQEATYIIKKPFDDGKELGSTLPKVIAWRKCVLESQAKRDAAAAVGAASALPGSSSTNDVDEEGEDEEEGRVHFKVVKSTVRNRKRKSGSGGDPGASSYSAAAGVTGCCSISPNHLTQQIINFVINKTITFVFFLRLTIAFVVVINFVSRLLHPCVPYLFLLQLISSSLVQEATQQQPRGRST